MQNKVRDIILKRTSFIITLLLLLSAVALLRVATTHKDVDDVANIDLPLIEILTQIETNQLEQSLSFERAIRYAEEIGKNDYAYVNFIEADSSFRYMAKLVDQDLLVAEKQVTDALERTSQEAQQIKLRGLLLSVKKLVNDHESYEENVISVLNLLERDSLDEALLITEKVEAEEDQFNKQIEGVLMRHEMFTEALVDIVEEEEVMSMKWIVILTLVFVIFSLVAVFTFSYTIWRPLEDIRAGAEKLGAGHLDTRIKLRSTSVTEDIVNAFNAMAADLQSSREELDRFIHFSYSTANDLRAPVDTVKNLLDMLSKQDLRQADFDAIMRNTKRAAEQLGDTVEALNKVNQLRERLIDPKESLSFDKVLSEVGASLIDQIKNSNAVIKKDFSAVKEIQYPKVHLNNIITHLLTNAIKYRNPEKPLVVHIRTSVLDKKIVLTFRDNGLGFDGIKYKDDVVKPFVRLHTHTTGSGLGMYIVKTILDYHGDEIKVESQPKKGAKFTITFWQT